MPLTHDGACVQCESLQLVGLWLHLCVMCLFTMRLFSVCLPMPHSRHAPPRPSILRHAHLCCPSGHLFICCLDTRQATRDTRDTQLSRLVSRVSHRTSHTLNIQLFSHLFQIYNCFLCSHTHMDTHRLKLAFGTWLVLCSVKYYRLECRVESFNWRKERKCLDGFQVLELGTPLVCCVY